MAFGLVVTEFLAVVGTIPNRVRVGTVLTLRPVPLLLLIKLRHILIFTSWALVAVNSRLSASKS